MYMGHLYVVLAEDYPTHIHTHTHTPAHLHTCSGHTLTEHIFHDQLIALLQFAEGAPH